MTKTLETFTNGSLVSTVNISSPTLAIAKKIKTMAIDVARNNILAAGKTILTHTMDGRLPTMGAIVSKRDRVERKSGAAVKSVTDISSAAEGMITVTGGAPSDQLEVQFAEVGGTTELNGNVYFTSDRSGNTFKIKDRLGNYVDTSAMGSYTSGGTVTVVATTIDVNNNLVVLNYDDFSTLSDALSEWHNVVYEQARVYKNAVEALSTIEDVDDYDVTALTWPS